MWETNIPLPKFEHEIIWNSWIHEQKGQKKWMKKHPSHPPKCSWRSNRPGRCNVKPPWSRQCSPERPPHSNGVHPTSHIHMSWMYNKCMNQIESRAISRFVHQLLTSSCFNCLAPPEKAKFQWIGFKHLIFIFIFHHLPSSSIIFHWLVPITPGPLHHALLRYCSWIFVEFLHHHKAACIPSTLSSPGWATLCVLVSLFVSTYQWESPDPKWESISMYIYIYINVYIYIYI